MTGDLSKQCQYYHSHPFLKSYLLLHLVCQGFLDEGHGDPFVNRNDQITSLWGQNETLCHGGGTQSA